MIIERTSGKRYAEFLAERFFRPLGMTSTSVLDHARVLKHRAAGYTLTDDGQLINIGRVVNVELPSHFGVFLSVKDLVAWDAALATGRAVKPASLAQMWTPVKLNYGGHYPYGFGWFVGERRGHRWITHGGITGTEFSRFPADSLTVIVLTNLGRRVGSRARVNNVGLTYGDDSSTRLLERHGERVSRVCHYRFVNATATHYYSFWLLPDGRIADIWSSTE